ncbi:uric acid degradation bifunctional protein TTL-like [Zingiber officinale]|uniref:uric acid degradation bifunctional protein TTL-like n=1 Tax=Zingiber officinale TaxID=94328 RepID=UPI001C4BAD4F|nr:uric acid degradation bifunctional protein TTL-like [Zingiber officinale]
MASFSWTEEDVLRCCGSKRFAKELAFASPFFNLHHVIQWSKEEQSATMAIANDTTLQEKFGFVFLICASGRGTLEILVELKDSPASPSVAVALAGTMDGPANDEGNLSDAKGLAKEAAFLFQNRQFQECDEILSQIFDKKRDDVKVLHNIAVAKYF